MDSKQHILFGSCHPKHINLAQRIFTAVYDGNARDLRLEDHRTTLTERHYPPSPIEDGIKRAKKIGMKALRETNLNPTFHLKILSYISIHSPSNNEPNKTIVQNLATLRTTFLKRINSSNVKTNRNRWKDYWQLQSYT